MPSGDEIHDTVSGDDQAEPGVLMEADTSIHDPVSPVPKAPAHLSYRSSATHQSPTSPDSLKRYDLSPTISPAQPRQSITPRNDFARGRVSASITPTAISMMSQTRISTASDTRSPLAEELNLGDSGDAYDNMEYDYGYDAGWGDDAVLRWDGASIADDAAADSASSVAPGDAGLATETENDDDDQWGREAYMDFDDWTGREEILDTVSDSFGSVVDGGGAARHEGLEDIDSSERSEEEVEMVERLEDTDEEVEEVEQPGISSAVVETRDDLLKRGMPDYSTWDLKRLQRLCEGFGYRPSTNHSALEKIAENCWRALNLPPATTVTPKRVHSASKMAVSRAADRAERSNSVSSADVPLSAQKFASATAKTSAKPRGKSKAKAIDISESEGESGAAPTRGSKGKAKAKSKAAKRSGTVDMSASEADDVVDADALPLEKRFYNMIMGDAPLYLRIIQYEPISFDEFVSKAIRAGIKDKGWKIHLKKFLDFEGITFYTEDPTGPRRRH